MSLAVSVIVKPSRLLLVLIAVIFITAISISIFLGLNNKFPYLIRVLFSSLGLFLSFFGFCHIVKTRKNLHISISNVGQIRINKLDCSPHDAQRANINNESNLVYLLNDSVILPYLIILHLSTKSGKIIIVPILPGVISRDDFRALLVACKWITNHQR